MPLPNGENLRRPTGAFRFASLGVGRRIPLASAAGLRGCSDGADELEHSDLQWLGNVTDACRSLYARGSVISSLRETSVDRPLGGLAVRSPKN